MLTKLPAHIPPLDKRSIAAEVQAQNLKLLCDIILLNETLSTNTYLIELAKNSFCFEAALPVLDSQKKRGLDMEPSAILKTGFQPIAPKKDGNLTTSLYIATFAETQIAGRGRQEKLWISPPGNIYLSVLTRWATTLASLSNFSIVMGKAVITALTRYGIKDNLQLKWPNDVLWKSKKLAGILIETAPVEPNVYDVVVGIGLNVMLPKHAGEKISQPWTDLTAIEKATPNRNRIAGVLLDEVISALRNF